MGVLSRHSVLEGAWDGLIEDEINEKGQFVLPSYLFCPTDIVFPKEFAFVWDIIKPLRIEKS